MLLQGRTILVVEDNFLVGEDIAALIINEGGSVIGPVSSLAEAIYVVSGTKGIDVAVLDVSLGCATVYPAAAILRRNAVPFVFFSAKDRSLLHRDYCAEPLITKPSSSVALIESLAQAVSARRA